MSGGEEFRRSGGNVVDFALALFAVCLAPFAADNRAALGLALFICGVLLGRAAREFGRQLRQR
jgi:hypothetical protein